MAVTDDGMVVLAKPYRHGLQRALLERPSGCVEAQDPSPRVAAQRELLEETGYAGERCIATGLVSANPATHTNVTSCVLATGVQQVAEPALDETEQLEVILTSLEDVIEQVQAGGFLQALHVGALFLALRTLGRRQIR